MRINKCFIENFGKHSKFEYIFPNNYNVILEDNGWGKSTLAIFIKAMFYGMPATRKSNFDENDRKKYTPWQSGNFGGYIEFEVNSKQYRLERYFGKKESDDTFNLIDLSTNKKSNDYDENIGITLFGLDAEAYERSTFIPQKLIDGGINESLSSKLTNMIHGTDCTDSYDNAVNQINRRKSELKNKQNHGELSQVESEIYRLNQDVQTIKSNAMLINRLDDEISREENEISVCEKELIEIKNKIKSYAETKDIIAKKQILGEYEKNEQSINLKLRENAEVLNNKPISREDISRVRDSYQKLVQEKNNLNSYKESSFLDEKYNNLNNYFHSNVPSDETLNEMEYKINEWEDKKENKNVKVGKRKIPFTLIISSVIAIILLVVGIFNFQSTLWSIASFILAGLSIVFGFLHFAFTNKKSNKDIEEIANNHEQEIIDFISKYEPITSAYEVHIFSIKTKKKELEEVTVKIKDIIDKINEHKNNILELENTINNFIQGFKLNDISIEDKLNKLSEILYENESLMKQRNELRLKKSSLEDYQKIKDVNIENVDIEYLQAKEKDVQIRIDTRKESKSKLSLQKSKLNEELSKLTDLESEINLKEEKRIELEDELKMLKLVNQYLEIAKDELNAKYLSPMKLSFDKFMNKINLSDKVYNLDTDLNVSVMEYGKSRESDYLSKGYQTLVDLCVRFALIDTIFTKEKPFIILDDPFVNLDKEKISKSLSLLNDVANDYQIIYLTCHESRV